ncbi:hypothetical protein HA402_014435 [Bradysia odoriphaga]|nr:hypothetical protein HA402_014435 [Bradysia odoriphaga]
MPNLQTATITVDNKVFVEGFEQFIVLARRITLKVYEEARAIMSFMARVNDDLIEKGFPVHVIASVKLKLLKLQRDFLTYLKETDGPARILSLKQPNDGNDVTTIHA